jgi:hypothetical protein
MCVNDVLCCGAKPLFFLDYIATGKLIPEKIASIVSGVAEGCRQAGAALIGGETAEMPGFYPEDEYDLAGFTVGMVDKSKVIDGSKVKNGDVVIGISSSGVHSNGFSLVRKVFGLNTDKAYDNLMTEYEELGTTLDGLISSTADFARLGYGFEDSQKLAEVANIYAVVGDEIEGVEDATQSLVSTMAAFKSEMNGVSDSDFALSIVDKMNEVSNNFAISSGGIGQALQRSASSMAAANNTIDETIALITAANTVAQNPEKVGKRLCRLKKWLYRLKS